MKLFPIIEFNHIREGVNKGRCQITAHGIEIAVIDYATQGWTSSSQENTLAAIQKLAEIKYPEGFILPYYVDGGGYVYRDNTKIEAQNRAWKVFEAAAEVAFFKAHPELNP